MNLQESIRDDLNKINTINESGDGISGEEARKLILQGKEVTKVIGDLDLSRTQITALPANLTVQGDVDLWNTPITSLPDNLTVSGGLFLGRTHITSLPDDLTVGRNLRLEDTPIKSLGNNLRVGGDLALGNTPNLDKDNLPSSLYVSFEILY